MVSEVWCVGFETGIGKKSKKPQMTVVLMMEFAR